MMDLNDLLKSAQEQAAAREAAKETKGKLKDARLNDKERAVLHDKLRELESRSEYKATALVWRARRVTCSCSAVTIEAGQVLVEETHIRIANTRRWIEAKTPWPDLPAKQQYVEAQVLVCGYCARAKGFV
jgi:hypothetical protein